MRGWAWFESERLVIDDRVVLALWQQNVHPMGMFHLKINTDKWPDYRIPLSAPKPEREETTYVPYKRYPDGQPR